MTRPERDFVVVDVALVKLARVSRNFGSRNRLEDLDEAVIHRRGHRWQLWCAGLLHAGQPEASGLLQILLPRP